MMHHVASEAPRSSLKSAISMATLLAFEAGAIVALHRLASLTWMTIPWHRLGNWLESAPLEDVVAATIRSIALATAYWIAATTAVYMLARLTRLPRLIGTAARATLPPIQRVVDRVVAVAVAAVALSGPIGPGLAADISTPPPPADPLVFEISETGVPVPRMPQTAKATLVAPPGVAGPGYTLDVAGGATGPAPVMDTLYEVVPGDNLWIISARHLGSLRPGLEASPDEISTYWRHVIEINTPQLRSGDPNLIYPGEQIVLPATDRGANP